MSLLVRLPTRLYQRDAFDRFASQQFSEGAARAAIWLSQLTYEDEPAKIASILHHWQLASQLTFQRPLIALPPMPSTGGLIAAGRDTVFIAFQGTDPLVAANWGTNFRFETGADGIHRGFREALDAVWNDIKAALARLPASPVIVTGHSLGGALAVLCADRLDAELGTRPAAIYTFGMPRVGNAAFARRYNRRLGAITYRFIHGHDIVPAVPPTSLGFRHVGRDLSCRADERFDGDRLAARPSNRPALLDDALERARLQLARATAEAASLESADLLGLFDRVLPPAVAHHLPHRYWRALEPA